MEIPESVLKILYSGYEKRLTKDILKRQMPRHIAVIMDGNRRYAAEHLNNDKKEGHKKGEKKIEELIEWCFDLNIPYVTVYAFSTDNFKREKDEVDYLMELAESLLYKMADSDKIHEHKVRINVFGDNSILPDSVVEAIEYAHKKTGHYRDFMFNVAMAYGGRQEIVSAVKEMARKVKNGELEVDDISENTFSQHLYTGDTPDPDLILRTSGEVRMSNFLLWQLAYSELYFADVFWPGFRRVDFLRAIRSYQQRIRRYGE